MASNSGSGAALTGRSYTGQFVLPASFNTRPIATAERGNLVGGAVTIGLPLTGLAGFAPGWVIIEKASGDDTLEDLEGEARALASKIAAKKAALKANA